MALSKIDVANMLTGATPVANGGTGLTSGTTNQFLKFTGSTTLASAADNAGTVKQIQHGEYSTQVVSNSQSLTLTGLNASITPESTSSKILILINQRLDLYGGANIGDLRFSWRVRRDISGGSNTTIRNSNSDADQGLYTEGHSSDNIYRGFMTQALVDSPSTTSACTYRTLMQEHNSSASITSGYSYGFDSKCSMMLLEF